MSVHNATDMFCGKQITRKNLTLILFLRANLSGKHVCFVGKCVVVRSNQPFFSMWNDGGYLRTSELMGYKKEAKVIWSSSSTLHQIKRDKEIIVTNKPTLQQQTIPQDKIHMLRQNTRLSLAFNRNESPKPHFAPAKRHVVHDTPPHGTIAPTESFVGAGNNKAAALERVDKLRRRRLQLSCRAINSLEELSYSWTPRHSKNSSSNSSNTTTVLMISPPSKQKHKRQKHGAGTTSPRESRFRLRDTSSTIPVHGIDPLPSPSITRSPTLNTTMVTQLASQFSAPLQNTNRTGRQRTVALLGTAADSEYDSDSSCSSCSTSSTSTSTSNTSEDPTHTKMPVSYPHKPTKFRSLANTKRVMHKFLQKSRMIRELKQLDSSSVRKKNHSALVVSKLHGFLAQQRIDKLMSATGYSRSQLYSHFLRFKALCAASESPEGISRFSFRTIFPELAMEDRAFVDRVYTIIDSESRGLLDWPHYIQAMASLEQGTSISRTTFLWSVYDNDGNGTISRAELKKYFVSSLMTAADSVIEELSEMFVEGVFSRIVPNEKGELTLSEAVRYIESQEEVSDLHGMFGRSMNMQGFAGIVDGTRGGDAATEESKHEKIARRVRKSRREQGLDTTLTVTKSSTTTTADKNHHASALIHAATNVKQSKVQGRRQSVSIDLTDLMEGAHSNREELEWDLKEELNEMHRRINDATKLNAHATVKKSRTSVMGIRNSLI